MSHDPPAQLHNQPPYCINLHHTYIHHPPRCCVRPLGNKTQLAIQKTVRICRHIFVQQHQPSLVGIGWPQACLNLCCESMRKRAQTDYCILLNITAYSCMAYRYFFRWVEPCKVFKIQTEPDPRRCNGSSNGGASQV